MINAIWMWGALGLILLAVEMATGTFYILWFGIAGLCLAIITSLMPSITPALQFTIYALLSLSSLAIWKIYYKKTETHYRVGQSQGEEIGRIGTVIESVSIQRNGRIRFAQGVMGSKEWAAIGDETIEEGSEAMVVGVVGNALKISKL